MATGMEYRRLAHKLFDGEITAQELAEAVEELRRSGRQLRLFVNDKTEINHTSRRDTCRRSKRYR